jgi:hypothetical protein
VVAAAAAEAVMSFWIGFIVGMLAGAVGVYATIRWYLLRGFRDM